MLTGFTAALFRHSTVVVFALLYAVNAATAAPKAKAARLKQIDIQYVPPKSDALKPVYEYLKDGKGLEKVQALLGPLRLPRRLLIKAAGCDGESNAWYEDDEVTICYEFLDDLWKNAATETTSVGLAPIDTLIGPFIDVVLHEVGHAVFDMLRIPVFGREEDAADQFSGYIVLQASKPEARRLILGNVYQYKGDLKPGNPPPSLKSFADAHGTPAQRFYNVLCMAYGFDKELFKDVVEKDYLPKDRAEGCEDEYKQVQYAFKMLIGPYIDRKLAAQAAKGYLPSPQVRLKRRPTTGQ